MEPRRVLVVANQTACGDELLEVITTRMAAGPCRFTLLVPATPAAEPMIAICSSMDLRKPSSGVSSSFVFRSLTFVLLTKASAWSR